MKGTNERLLAEADISADKPFMLRVEADGERVSLVIVGYDHPQLFTIFCGVLAASGLEIEEGTLTTTSPVGGRKLIIDRFTGLRAENMRISVWENRLRDYLTEFYAMLEKRVPRELIQQRLVELVVPSLRDLHSMESMLDPVHLKIIQGKSSTRLQIESSDTPFFLFNLGNVLNLHHLRIEHVSIETREGRLIDSIEFTDAQGQPVRSETRLNQIKLSVLITKQFTFFLYRAPDPTKALLRFANLIQNQMHASADLLELLASSSFHGELGRLLGASDFLWEDFIRVQQENIIPMLKNHEQLLSHSPEEIEAVCAEHLASVGPDMDARVRELNRFKNRESFLIDMDHIMLLDGDFFFLSDRLSALADAVIKQACAISWAAAEAKYGMPRTAGGLAAQWAVFGLGKLGGKALGYASDLELLFMFSDNGESDGEHSITNRVFFERFFKQAAGIISAKKKGIFQVDLRLRPYGMDGPVAVKLDAFNEYFRSGGKAHSAERLSLVRMRHIGGSKEFAEQCLDVRDHVVYESDSIIIPELRKLRIRQLQEKSREGSINVKFNPGGLVDLEYNVQILQVTHGRNHEELRGPGIHDALRVLSKLGTIDQKETDSMIGAYRFQRTIINGLRMLRGNAEDLFLPTEDSREFRHLARRIGYKKKGGLSEAEQLIIDFETHSARVRRFVEEHLGSDAIPGKRRAGIVDIVLKNSDDPADEEEQAEFFRSCGFRDPQRALVNVQRIAKQDRDMFLPLVILAWRRISHSADPDMALNNWEQFISRLTDPGKHFTQLLSKPARMDILFKLFARSQYLADILIQNPGFFLWATDPAVVTQPRTQIDMEGVLKQESDATNDRDDWRNRLRHLRKKEILRIGLRDIALGVKIEEIMGEITFLARSCIELALHRIIEHETDPSSRPNRNAWAENLVVLAFGKLGGWELNYSSDIDLLCVYRPDPNFDRDAEQRGYTGIFRRLVQDLGDFTQEGQAYRVDMRLRPYGASGPLVSSSTSLMEYYKNAASPWEFQALLKLKPVAGNLVLGEELLGDVTAFFYHTWSEHDPMANIATMREKSIAHHIGSGGTVGAAGTTSTAGTVGTAAGVTGTSADNRETVQGIGGFDIKNDHGGIRDIEFFLQGQQMLHGQHYPDILTGNTLRGLYLIEKAGIISHEMSTLLGSHYRFFRRVEHYLQLADNKQLHSLPEDAAALSKLVRCLYPAWNEERFFRYFKSAVKEVHAVYRDAVADP